MENTRPKPNRLLLSSVLAVLLVIQIGNWVAVAILALLVKHHPAWLIFLSPTTRNLLLATLHMSAVTFFTLAIVRRMLPHPLWFLIGRWYGESGIKWIEKRSPDIGALVGTLETHFPRFGWLLCTIYPHPLVCAMAGASVMSFSAFFFYTLVGIIGFVWASWAFGDVLHPVTSGVANFADHYKLPLTGLTVAIVAYSVYSGQRSGRSKIEPINQIEAELDGEPLPPAGKDPSNDERPQ